MATHLNIVHRRYKVNNNTSNNFINIAAILVIGVFTMMLTLLGILYNYPYFFIIGLIGFIASIIAAIIVAFSSISDAGKAIAEFLSSYRNYRDCRLASKQAVKNRQGSL